MTDDPQAVYNRPADPAPVGQATEDAEPATDGEAATSGDVAPESPPASVDDSDGDADQADATSTRPHGGTSRKR